ncbi:DNA methyltransferase [Flavobacterium sp. FPG59]|uniref:Eco57I restriction-modification methylase domain-containing protein n=1 Tax=Flavobacterium sp. FPG59 TaxID=1929267 RepID=UPI000A39777B|nr:DNA methyltransferase [Flavobacterium sp. FPG59]OUD34780.1 hypothetical protein FPG59_12425 [Flavobacterium sp. FPG59]
MTRIEQLFNQLGYTRENGLFYLTESEDWVHKFPYRISKVLRDIIKPFAFYSLHHHGDINSEHPEPINNPIILFFDKPDEEKRKDIPKWSFCFGQAPIVIINTSDDQPLDIFHGYSFASENSYLLKKIESEPSEFSLVNLTLGKTWKNLYHKYFKDVPKVDKYLLNNIIDARRILIASDGGDLLPKIANRLIGRLLFIRYLIDRRVEFKDQTYILGEDKLSRQISLNELIKDKITLYKFFHYLTAKYQGDLFPLYEESIDVDTGEILSLYDEESDVNTEHLEILYHLFSGSSFFKSGSSHKGYSVQPSLFMVYDFEVIPVELISNIYENFIGKKAENFDVVLTNYKNTKQFEIKAYYTPPFIVDYVLSQTVTPFIENQTVASCKILDPACGSGIFLVETLRKIIEKEILILDAKNEKISNQRLWELLRENIFGIDIDEDAIEITIFSLYITLLDYKTPIEIEDFRFERLRDQNLFGGASFDFFNETASFNEIFTQNVALDFILGNPPWGIVAASNYEKYIKERNLREAAINSELMDSTAKNISKPYLTLELGNREISQAFLVRVSDFAINPNLKIAMIVTGKSLYNSDSTCKNWREYFLSNFILNQVLELSCVNNKIVAGNQIFEEAKQAPAILFYQMPKAKDEILKHVVTHITVKPNRFFNYFRTIVIEKHDIKKILQRNFIRNLNGFDWLWKVMLHGNLLDFYFMKRLKSYDNIGDYMHNNDLTSKGGLKVTDGNNKKNTDQIKNYKFLDVEGKKEFKPFNLLPTLTWEQTIDIMRQKFTSRKPGAQGRNNIDSEGNVGYLPDIHFFRGEKLLVKKGLQAKEDFKAVAAYTNEDVIFTATVCAIKPIAGNISSVEISTLLKSLAAIINSRFFTYYVFNTSSSAGVDRTRIDFEEIFSAPALCHPDLASMVDQIQGLYKRINTLDFNDYNYLELADEVNKLEEKCQEKITDLFEVSTIEQSLIDYSTEIAIPILKRAEETGYGGRNIFKMLSISNDTDKLYLKDYAIIFVEHFKHRFNSPEQSFFVNIHIAEDFIGFHFIVSKRPDNGETVFYKGMEDSELLNEIGFLGIHSVTRDLYIQQDVRGFNKNTFYIIKPNEKKCWHKAIAHHDLLEFIDALARAETSNHKRAQV